MGENKSRKDHLFNQKLDDTLETKEINQIAIFKANELMFHDLVILDHGKTSIDSD